MPCYLVPIAAGMTQAICPPGARVSFDLDAIPALWEGRANLGKTLSKVTFLTTNEKREMLGFEPTRRPTTIMPAACLTPAPPAACRPGRRRPIPNDTSCQWRESPAMIGAKSGRPATHPVRSGIRSSSSRWPMRPEGYIAGIASTP